MGRDVTLAVGDVIVRPRVALQLVQLCSRAGCAGSVVLLLHFVAQCLTLGMQVFQELETRSCAENPDCYLLNPIVGPEAVTGSSRMKGGSMTKILLESLFVSCLIPLCGIEFASPSTTHTKIKESPSIPVATTVDTTTVCGMLMMYETIYRQTHRQVAHTD